VVGLRGSQLAPQRGEIDLRPRVGDRWVDEHEATVGPTDHVGRMQVTVGYDRWHHRDDFRQPVAQALDGASVSGFERLSGKRLRQVAEQTVLGEEGMTVVGPRVVLGEPSEVAVAVPTEAVVDRAEV